MKLSDALDAMSTNGQPAHVYSEPFVTPEGVTIIAVAKVRGKVRPSRDGSASGQEIAVRAKPMGVFVIERDGHSTWQPAVDATPVALVGVLTGLVSATLATLAMVRRPPWPDIRIS
jgi:hypothetical protein